MSFSFLSFSDFGQNQNASLHSFILSFLPGEKIKIDAQELEIRWDNESFPSDWAVPQTRHMSLFPNGRSGNSRTPRWIHFKDLCVGRVINKFSPTTLQQEQKQIRPPNYFSNLQQIYPQFPSLLLSHNFLTSKFVLILHFNSKRKTKLLLITGKDQRICPFNSPSETKVEI